MGKNNTACRGFSSKAMRDYRIEKLKKTLNRKQNQICEAFSRARAATALSRMGHHDLARKMMLKD